jgi:hypothetical protein
VAQHWLQTGPCEHYNAYLGSIKGREFID